MKNVEILQILSAALVLISCDDSMNYKEDKISSEQNSSFESSWATTSSSQYSSITNSSSSSNVISTENLVMDSRVVSYQQEINSIYSDSVRIIASIDSLKNIFPKSLDSNRIDKKCNYIGISVARADGLSYYNLTSNSVNANELTVSQIIPSLDKKCQFPLTFDWQTFLICDTSGNLNEKLSVKTDIIVDSEMSCTPESHYF